MWGKDHHYQIYLLLLLWLPSFHYVLSNVRGEKLKEFMPANFCLLFVFVFKVETLLWLIPSQEIKVLPILQLPEAATITITITITIIATSPSSPQSLNQMKDSGIVSCKIIFDCFWPFLIYKTNKLDFVGKLFSVPISAAFPSCPVLTFWRMFHIWGVWEWRLMSNGSCTQNINHCMRTKKNQENM